MTTSIYDTIYITVYFQETDTHIQLHLMPQDGRQAALRAYLKVKVESIYGDGVFPGIVLSYTSQESLCEEEAGYPVVDRFTLVKPQLQECQPLQEVCNVTTQRLERWV